MQVRSVGVVWCHTTPVASPKSAGSAEPTSSGYVVFYSMRFEGCFEGPFSGIALSGTAVAV